jgi:geranylgeranyl diphosphate synthase type I
MIERAPESEDRRAFGALAADVKTHVDAALGAWLGPRVAAAAGVSAEVGAAAEAVERLAVRGGKRLRAALIGASYAACGGEGDFRRVDRAMIAVELLQTYLLIHDDWMDDDDVRRGGPAVHVVLRERLGDARLGDAAAVLAGDLACGYAQSALLESAQAPARVLRAAAAFARIQEEVVTGQLAEMSLGAGEATRRAPAAAGGKMNGAAAAPTVEQIHAMKTASYTVTGPLALGATLAGADDATVAALARYGRPLGVAFQLRDDLLGVFGDPSETGKPIWNDIRQGKRTALVAELRGDAAAEALLARVLGDAAAPDAAIEEVVRAMESSGARARVEARSRELVKEARGALAAASLPGADGRRWLSGAIGAVGGERSS